MVVYYPGARLPFHRCLYSFIHGYHQGNCWIVVGVSVSSTNPKLIIPRAGRGIRAAAVLETQPSLRPWFCYCRAVHPEDSSKSSLLPFTSLLLGFKPIYETNLSPTRSLRLAKSSRVSRRQNVLRRIGMQCQEPVRLGRMYEDGVCDVDD